MTNFESVKIFMETFGQEVKGKASFPNEKIVKLRSSLIEEEFLELKIALKQKNLEAYAKLIRMEKRMLKIWIKE